MTVASVLVLAAALAPAAAATPVVMSVGGPPGDPAFLASYAAEALGTFEAEGIRPTVRRAAHPGDAIRALRDAEATIAVTTADQAVRGAWARRTPVQILVAHTAAPAITLLVSAKHRGAVTGVADLRGQRVGIPGPGTTGHFVLAALLRREEIEPWQLDLVSLGGAALIAGLGTGNLAAAMVGEPWTHRALASGGAHVLIDFRRQADTVRHLDGPFYEIVSVIRTSDTAPAEPALAAVVRALIRVQAWLASTPPAAIVDRLPRHLTGDGGRFQSRLEALQDTYVPDGMATEAGLSTTFRILRQGSPWPAELRLRPRDLLEPPFATAARAQLGPTPPPP